MNKVILTGRLTKEPEVKRTASNKVVMTFSLAVDRHGKDKNTDFPSCVAWGTTKKASEEPKANVALICERCGKPIESAGKFPPSAVAEQTRAKFGKQMCFECGKATKKEREQPIESVLADLPFPIEE